MVNTKTFATAGGAFDLDMPICRRFTDITSKLTRNSKMKPRRHVRDTLERAPYLGEKFWSVAGPVEFTKLQKIDEAVGVTPCDYCALANTDQCEDADCECGYMFPFDKEETELNGYYKKIEVDEE
jgi:hypothetical protein